MSVFTSIAEQLGLKATPIVERALDRDAFDLSTEVRRATSWALGLGPEAVWNSQPYVRTVVTFLARNIAQLGVHSFRRVDDDQRERLRDHPIAQLFARPNADTTTFELIFGLVCDKALYERAYWLIGTDGATDAPTLTRIPPSRVIEHVTDDPLGHIDKFRVRSALGDKTVDMPASRVLYFPGWNPTSAVGMPSSPLDAIKGVIAEQAAAFEFRKLAWANGAQVGTTIERPQGVAWKDGARDRFIEDVRSQFSGNGPRRGGVMLLEDGMKLSGQQFNAREAEWIEAAKLSLALVAAIYHVNPTMVGLLDNANYSNVREFRKMLYGDTLGPLMASIEDRINTFLVPRFDDSGEVYCEFNIAEKLQGSFEEQAAAMQTSVGAPWMSRAEARARLNLPPIDDADGLVIPLNVLVGGQASPRDSAPPSSTESASASSSPARSAPASSGTHQSSNVIDLKRRASEQQQRKVDEVLRAFFGRQSSAVLSRLKAGRDDWWDEERWDRELTRDMHAVLHELTSIVGADEAKRLGFADAYDSDRTVEYLSVAAQRYATNINSTTKSQLDDAIADDDAEPAAVFEQASSSRAAGIATVVTTFAVGFALRESAAQIAQSNDVEPTKTWITGPNARESHAAMNGQTVPIDEPFSNGMQYPAESGGIDEVAGCNCSIEISV